MIDTGHAFVSPDQLRVGLYIELELGWMSHPFPKGSFKISSDRQIETLRGLGLKRVRYVPAKSDPEVQAQPAPALPVVPDGAPASPDADPAQEQLMAPQQRRESRHAVLLQAQRESLARCDQKFGAAIRRYEAVLDQLKTEPTQAGRECRELVDEIVFDVLGQGECSILLLSEGIGERTGMHPVNVTVLSLLLGDALGLSVEQLHDLGTAAFLHDIGKTKLAERVRSMHGGFSAADLDAYRGHVAHGVLLAKRLGLADGATRAIAEHHELADGSGFPRQTRGDAISMPGRILALVNRYENMCNPSPRSPMATPHEALSLIFSQSRARFDAAILNAFIRMMGVYPPGSVVQLANDRFALVVSVNSMRPLRPRVLVHDPAVARDQALVLDLEQPGAPGIRRSVRPAVLPKATMDYLSPRLRICYFFERAVLSLRTAGGA